MQTLLCTACGQSNSEFDALCSACGAPLSSTDEATIVEDARPEVSPAVRRDGLLGRQISHFRIQNQIGRGGMGVVYKAVDLDLGRVVALKFLSHGERGPRAEVRFRREAQAAAALDHPNIGTLYEVGEHEGQRFIAMAFYDGETLASRLAREHRLAFPEAASIAGQLASALAAAHGAGIVHRDLKPENVMITRDGRVKLLDFGLAKWAEAPSATEQGVAVGTAAYMAPEQLRGHEIGAATDLWAFGVVLYQMLTGERPFGGERRGMVHAILYEDPPPLRGLRPDVPEALERIAARCLAKEPGERCPDAASVLAELSAAGLWESGSSSASASLTLAHQARRPWLWLAAALLLLAVGVAAAFFLLRKPEPPVYVAVLKPEVSGSLPTDDSAQVKLNLQSALLRTVAALDGLAALDTVQVNAVKGTPVQVARATAAGEVVAAQADCAGDLCQVSLRRLDGADGRVLWSSALRLPSSDPRLFANAVAASLRQGYGDHGLRVPRLELEVGEQDYRTFLALRQQLAAPKDLDEILARLGALRQRAPSFLDVYVLEAKVARRLYSDTGEERYLDQGLAVARKARELAPGNPQPLEALFFLNLHSGRLSEAEALLKQIEEIDPAASLLRRGQLAERQGKPEEALKWMSEAVRLQPSSQALLTLANAEYRQSRLDNARRHLEQLLKRSPGDVEGLQALAQVELLRNSDQAVALLQEAARRDPGPKSITNLGVALLLLHRYGEAEKSFRQALDLQPGDPSASLNLADCLTLAGRPAEARPLYVQVADTAERMATPSDWHLLSVQAQALAHLGETVKAVGIIQQALRLTPDNAQLAYEAAVVYVLVGDRGSALFQVRQAANRGMGAHWFALPFFDSLRDEPDFPSSSLSRRSVRS